MSRVLWFAAGAGAGIYGMIRARRAAEALTPEGLRDRWQALGVGARMLRDEVAAGRVEKEIELRERLVTRSLAQPSAPALEARRAALEAGDAPDD